MITKAIVQKIDRDANQCLVRVPLFESASSTNPVVLIAYPSIVPGLFNNLYVGDIVYVGFEENAMEKPIILGKFYKNAKIENKAKGGAGNFNTLNVLSKASIPSTTRFRYRDADEAEYEKFNTPRRLTDRVKENIAAINYLELYTQPWNLRIDDGDLDIETTIINDTCRDIGDRKGPLILTEPPKVEKYADIPPAPSAATVNAYKTVKNQNFSYRIESK